MAAIIRRTERKRKAALYQEAEGLLNDISKSEEHFGADSYEVGFALTCILQLHAYTALLSLLHRAWT
jgi:hypothetical protein